MGGPRSDPREVPPTMVSENPVAIEIIEIGDAASVAFWGHVNERALGVIRKGTRRFKDHELMTSRIPILRLTEEASCGGWFRWAGEFPGVDVPAPSGVGFAAQAILPSGRKYGER